MEHPKLLAVVAVVWIIINVTIATIGGKHKNKPNPKFDKVPIIIGISVQVLIAILAVIGYYFF